MRCSQSDSWGMWGVASGPPTWGVHCLPIIPQGIPTWLTLIWQVYAQTLQIPSQDLHYQQQVFQCLPAIFISVWRPLRLGLGLNTLYSTILQTKVERCSVFSITFPSLQSSCKPKIKLLESQALVFLWHRSVKVSKWNPWCQSDHVLEAPVRCFQLVMTDDSSDGSRGPKKNKQEHEIGKTYISSLMLSQNNNAWGSHCFKCFLLEIHNDWSVEQFKQSKLRFFGEKHYIHMKIHN